MPELPCRLAIRDRIAAEMSRDKRVVLLDEDVRICGYSGEVISACVEDLGSIAARRVTMPDLPVPFSPILEDSALPTPPAIVAAVLELAITTSYTATASPAATKKERTHDRYSGRECLWVGNRF